MTHFVEVLFGDFEAEAWRAVEAAFAAGRRKIEIPIDGGTTIFHPGWAPLLCQGLKQRGYSAVLLERAGIERAGISEVDTTLIVTRPPPIKPPAPPKPRPIKRVPTIRRQASAMAKDRKAIPFGIAPRVVRKADVRGGRPAKAEAGNS